MITILVLCSIVIASLYAVETGRISRLNERLAVAETQRSALVEMLEAYQAALGGSEHRRSINQARKATAMEDSPAFAETNALIARLDVQLRNAEPIYCTVVGAGADL